MVAISGIVEVEAAELDETGNDNFDIDVPRVRAERMMLILFCLTGLMPGNELTRRSSEQ